MSKTAPVSARRFCVRLGNVDPGSGLLVIVGVLGVEFPAPGPASAATAVEGRATIVSRNTETPRDTDGMTFRFRAERSDTLLDQRRGVGSWSFDQHSLNGVVPICYSPDDPGLVGYREGQTAPSMSLLFGWAGLRALAALVFLCGSCGEWAMPAGPGRMATRGAPP